MYRIYYHYFIFHTKSNHNVRKNTPSTAVVCDLSNYELKNNKTSIGLHIDEAVGLEGLTDSHRFIAHQVNVFYVDVAPDMIGGELEIWRYGSGDLSNVSAQSKFGTSSKRLP